MELKASRACVTQQQTHYIQLKIKRVETPWLIYYSNTRPSFLFTLKPSEVRPSVLKAGPNVSKAQPEPFKGSTTCFETNTRPSLFVNGHIKNFG